MADSSFVRQKTNENSVLKKSVKDLAAESTGSIKYLRRTEAPDLKNIDFGKIGNQATYLGEGINLLKHKKFALAYSSNVVSTGLRDLIIKLIQENKLVSIFATAGAVEEDIIKMKYSTYHCGFKENGEEMRKSGYNRIGGVAIHNEAYEWFEKEMNEFYSTLTGEVEVTPTELLYRVGQYFSSKYSEESILSTAIERSVPYYPVGITDGSFGDIISFSEKNENIFCDVVRDFKDSVQESKVDLLIVGDGHCKNRILSSCKNIGNVVHITTREYYDSSDIIEVKYRADSYVKICGDATIVLPLLLKNILC